MFDFIALIILLTPLAIFSFKLFHNMSLKKLINRSFPKPIKDCVNGFTHLEGTVMIPDRAEALISPVNKKKCVFYKLEVERDRGSSDDSNWQTVFKEEKKCDFILEDTSGRAFVITQNAQFVLDDLMSYAIIVPDDEIEDNAKDYLYNKGIDLDKISDHKRGYEKVIEVGQKIEVLGTCKQETLLSEKTQLRMEKKGKTPFWITQSKKVLKSELNSSLFTYALFSAINILVIVMFIIYGTHWFR